MKKLSSYWPVLIPVIIVSFAIIFSLYGIGGERDKDLPNPEKIFTMKSYQDYIKLSNTCASIRSPRDRKHYKCNLGYRNQIERSHTVSIRIYIYDDSFAPSEELMEEIVYQNKWDNVDTFVIDETRNVFVKKQEFGKVVNNDYRWISDVFRIEIRSAFGDVPEIILDDYRYKYPPTVDLTPDKIDPQIVLRRKNDKDFEAIYELEEKRKGRGIIPPGKSDVYEAMTIQCVAEITVRCHVGLYESANDVNCPITAVPGTFLACKLTH